MYKYGQPLTKAASVRLSRLRAEGKITADMAADEVYRLATTPRQGGIPKDRQIGTVPPLVRKRLKALYGLTPKQVFALPDSQARLIMYQCQRAAKVHGNSRRVKACSK